MSSGFQRLCRGSGEALDATRWHPDRVVEQGGLRWSSQHLASLAGRLDVG
jgi:hypothetical protein